MSDRITADIRILEKKKIELSRDVESIQASKRDQLSALSRQLTTARDELDFINKKIVEGKKQLRAINDVIEKKIALTEQYVKKITDESIKMANKRIHVADSIRGSFFPKKG